MNTKVKNKLKYYVFYKDDYLNDVVGVAQVDPQTHCFYDYHYYSNIENLDDFQIGNTAILGDDGQLKLADSTINTEVTEIIAKNEDFYKKLKDKYASQLETVGHIPETDTGILSDYLKDRIKNNQPVDLYVYNIVLLLSSAMGLRLRWERYGMAYNQMSPFTYPEELYEILSAMYNIISEKLANNESMRFLLYDYGGINDEYAKFLDEIERRTRYNASSFGSDLGDKIQSEAFNGANWGYSEARRRLSIMKPLVTISPLSTKYYHDIASDDAYVETTTPEKAKEIFGYIVEQFYNSDDESISNGRLFF